MIIFRDDEFNGRAGESEHSVHIEIFWSEYDNNMIEYFSNEFSRLKSSGCSDDEDLVDLRISHLFFIQ